jgi:hypothetical protein
MSYKIISDKFYIPQSQLDSATDYFELFNAVDHYGVGDECTVALVLLTGRPPRATYRGYRFEKCLIVHKTKEYLYLFIDSRYMKRFKINSQLFKII